MEGFKKSFNDATSYVTQTVKEVHIQEEASVVFNRAKQFTDEKLGRAERTDLDPHLVNLELKTDNCKSYTEKIRDGTSAVLIPNPAQRAESLFFDNVPVDKIGLKNERLTNLEYLGNDMIEAGNEFGVRSPYGAALVRVGQTEQKLGQIEKTYISGGNEALIVPLQRFMDGEMKNILRERKVLENKRLDLDACKNKVKKARALATQPQKEGVDPRAMLDQAENELRICQAEFDRQAEISRLLMEGLSNTQTNHLRHLKDFVTAQATYYAEAYAVIQELNNELSGNMEEGADTSVNITVAPPPPTTTNLSNQHSPTVNGTNGMERTPTSEPQQDSMSSINLASPPPVAFPKNAQVF